jgi:hypothetical protein
MAEGRSFLKILSKAAKIVAGPSNNRCGQVRLPERVTTPRGLTGRGSPLHRRGN